MHLQGGFMSKINPSYTSAEGKKKIVDSFNGDLPALTLHSFFEEKTYESFQNAVARLSFSKQHIPDKYRYGFAPIPKKFLSFLHSEEFLEFISYVLGKKVTQLEAGGSYEFYWKNYTLLHDELLLDKGVDLIFDFTPQWDESWGGTITYTEPDKEPLVLLSLPNSFFVIKRPDDVQRFIKYVNHLSGDKKRYFVLVTLDQHS